MVTSPAKTIVGVAHNNIDEEDVIEIDLNSPVSPDAKLVTKPLNTEVASSSYLDTEIWRDKKDFSELLTILHINFNLFISFI